MAVQKSILTLVLLREERFRGEVKGNMTDRDKQPSLLGISIGQLLLVDVVVFYVTDLRLSVRAVKFPLGVYFRIF